VSKQKPDKLSTQLWDLARSGDLPAIAEHFKSMPESERAVCRRVTKEVQAAYQHARKGSAGIVRDPDGKRMRISLYDFELVSSAFNVATESKAGLSTLSGWHIERSDGVLPNMLADRNPPWLQEYIEESLDRAGAAVRQWYRLARYLLSAGLIRKPESQGYVLGLLSMAEYGGTRKDSLVEYVLENRDLLEDLWLVFEVEGSPEISLASLEKYHGHNDAFRWSVALKQLSINGHLDRDRLLDESLNSLARDFSQYRAGWFSRFHEFMEPTVEERSRRVETYCNLLPSNVPPTVSFALKALEQVQKAGKLEPNPFLDAIGRAMRAEQKGTAKLAIRMLERLAKSKSTRTAALAAAVPAIEHPAAEVQTAGLKLFRKFGVPDGTVLSNYVDGLTAPVIQEFADLLGEVPEPEPSTVHAGELLDAAKALPDYWAGLAGIMDVLSALEGGVPVSALELSPLLVPRLDPKRLEPLRSLDELIECAAQVVELPNDPDEIERMIDGICRLCGERPADFEARTGQLAKRARHFVKRHVEVKRSVGEVDVRRTISRFILDWLGGGKMEDPPKGRYWDSIFVPRLTAISPRIKDGHPFQALSTPTHRRGWLDAQVLVERIITADGIVRDDLILALMRLAPDGREQALARLPNNGTETCRAVSYALGGPAPENKPTDFGLWHAAAIARSFGAGDEVMAEHFGALGDFFRRPRMPWKITERRGDVYRAYDFSIALDWGPRRTNPEQLTTTLRSAIPLTNTWGWFVTEEAARWTAHHLPVDLELYFGATAFALAGNLDWFEAEWGNRFLLEPLLDPDRALTPMPMLCLTIALGAKQAGESGLATDILIAAIEDGRLDGSKLGACMGELMFTGLMKPQRWASTLGEVSRVSALHEQVVRLSIENALAAGGESKPPRGLKSLLELYFNLAVSAGESVNNQAARRYLEKLQGSSGQGNIAKALIALKAAGSSSHSKHAALLALRGRISRAQRWAHYSPI
jgi:hypothetical protein